MNLFYQPNIREGVLLLDAEESRHCYKVLRKKTGDVIQVTDGKGSLYQVILTETKPDKCSFKIQSVQEEPKRMANIHLGIAPTKNTDRMEWFVEKATEIGIDTISLLLCAHSERAAIKTDRLEKIAISAMKQSLKYKLPGIQPMQLLKDFLNAQQAPQKFIAFVDQQNPDHLVKVAKPGIDSIVLIGPEGDFSTKEVELAQSYGYKKIGLGPSRLRTETAGLVSCHILNLINNT